MPFDTRSTVWFVLRFSGAFTALLLLWPVIMGPYARAASSIGSALLPASERVALAFSTPAPGAQQNLDYPVMLSVRVNTTGQSMAAPIDLRTLAYLPTAALIALALATPIWRSWRGPRLLLITLGVLNVFLVCSMGVPLLLFFANPEPLQLVTLDRGTALVLDILYRSLVAPPGMSYAVPGVLWVIALWLFPAPDATARRIPRFEA